MSKRPIDSGGRTDDHHPYPWKPLKSSIPPKPDIVKITNSSSMKGDFYYPDIEKKPGMIRNGPFTWDSSSLIRPMPDSRTCRIKLLVGVPSSTKSLGSPYRFRST